MKRLQLPLIVIFFLSGCNEEQVSKVKVKNESAPVIAGKHEQETDISKQQIRQKVESLELFSIMQSDRGQCCMIGSSILFEGDSIKGFKVREISNDSVKLEWESQGDEMHFGDQTESVEVVLKLSDRETALLPVQESKLSSDPNKWTGFRNLTWGTNIRDMNDPNMVLEEEDKGLAFYKRLDDKLSIGDAELSSLLYSCYEDRFCGVMIRTEQWANFRHLKDAVFAHYDEGYKPNQFIDNWIWAANPSTGQRDVLMILDYNEFSEETTLTILYEPIM